MPLEERRFKEMTEQQFGEKGGPQAKICGNIMADTGEGPTGAALVTLSRPPAGSSVVRGGCRGTSTAQQTGGRMHEAPMVTLTVQ